MILAMFWRDHQILLIKNMRILDVFIDDLNSVLCVVLKGMVRLVTLLMKRV